MSKSELDEAWPDHSAGVSLARTASLLSSPERYVVRVWERASLEGDLITRRVSLQANSGPTAHFLLLARAARNKLSDLLLIEANQDHLPFLLGRNQSALLAKRLLELQCEKLEVSLQDPLVELITSVASVPRSQSLSLLTLLRRAAAAATSEALASTPLVTLAGDKEFMSLFRLLRSYQPLFLPISPKIASFEVAYSVEVGRTEYSVSSGKELVRALFGLSSYDMVFPVYRALNSQTMHFRFRAPANHYVTKCEVRKSSAIYGPDETPPDIVPTERYIAEAPAVVRYRPKDADGLVHVYFSETYLDPTPPPSLFVRVRLAERPFGQMGAALWRWLLFSGFLLALVNLGSRLVETQSSLGVTVLLAIPAFLGVTTLMTANLGALNVASGARIASLLSGLAALVGALALVAWNTSYANCARQAPKLPCSTKMPPGVATTLTTLKVATIVLLLYCAFWVIYGLIDYHRAKIAIPNDAEPPVSLLTRIKIWRKLR